MTRLSTSGCVTVPATIGHAPRPLVRLVSIGCGNIGRRRAGGGRRTAKHIRWRAGVVPVSGGHGYIARPGEIGSRLHWSMSLYVARLRRKTSCVRVLIEHGDAVRACIFAAEAGHARKRVVTGQARRLLGQHLGLALLALELSLLLLLLLLRLGASAQHAGLAFSRLGA